MTHLCKYYLQLHDHPKLVSMGIVGDSAVDQGRYGRWLAAFDNHKEYRFADLVKGYVQSFDRTHNPKKNCYLGPDHMSNILTPF